MNEPTRLTFLIDPDRKRAFEELCASNDVTVSQALRRFIAQQLREAGLPHADRQAGEPARG
jgi:antitoxin component of RelBE/YafQ-DinJ toxin-antitoxin module